MPTTRLQHDTAFLTRCEEIVQTDNVRRLVENWTAANSVSILKRAYRGVQPHPPNDQDLIAFLQAVPDETLGDWFVKDYIDQVDLEILLQLKNELVIATPQPS